MLTFKRIWKPGLLVVLIGLFFVSWPQWLSVKAGFITQTQLFAASYYGSNSIDTVTGVAHNTDGSFIIVGRSENPAWRGGKAFGTASPCTSNNAGGFITKFGSDGRSVIWHDYFPCGVAVPHKIALDAGGNVYVAGIAKTAFSNLINGTFSTAPNGADDPFVAKFSPDGTTLIWGTYHLGENELDDVHLAVVNQNEPVISGRQSGNGLTNRIFLARFSNDGKNRLAFTDFTDPQNATAQTQINGLAARADGIIYPVGYYQREANLQVPFLIGFNSAQSSMPEIWRNYASPTPADLRADTRGRAVTIDTQGNVLAAFTTDGGNSILIKSPQNPASNLTVLAGAYQNSHGRANGAAPSSFIARYSPTNGAILDATFFHSSLNDGRTNTTKVYGLATDTQNRVYLTGETACCLPFTTDAVDQTYSSGEGFLVTLNPEMSQLIYATYLGGSTTDVLQAISFGNGRIAVVGSTTSGDLATLGAVQNIPGGIQDGLVAVFAPPYDLQFALDTPQPQTVGVNQTSQPVTLKLYDSLTGAAVSYPKADLTLTLSSNSATGRFDKAANGAFNSPTLALKLIAGQTYLNFYYRDSASGSKTITITPPNGMKVLTYSLNVVIISAENSSYSFRANRLGAPYAQSLQVALKMQPAASSNFSLTNVIYSAGATNWLTLQNTTGGLPGALNIVPNTVPPVGTYSATVTILDTIYKTTTSFSVIYNVADVKLSIVSSPQTIGAGYDSGAIVIEISDSQTGNPVRLETEAVQLTLSSTSGNGSFKAPDGVNVASLIIAPGSYRNFFTYRDTSLGIPTIQVAANGFSSVSQPITIIEPANCSNSGLVVNSAADTSNDPCQLTLRAALANAAGLPEASREITFAPNVGTIVLTATLGTLPDGLKLTGGCSPQNSPKISLDAGFVPADNSALLEAAAANRLSGLAIYGYNGPILRIPAAKSLSAGCLYIGKTSDGQRFYPGKWALRVEAGGRLDLLPEKNLQVSN